jgi:hypothetical protein
MKYCIGENTDVLDCKQLILKEIDNSLIKKL